MNAPAPGSAEWLKYMTASKIAAVVGTSPYESRFSLWHKMHGDIPSGHVTDNPIFEYGHYLEPVLREWFAAQHPDKDVIPGAWVTADPGSLYAASPDGFVGEPDYPDHIPLEAKTARDAWAWGESGTDGPIPAGYYDQVQWQMFVTETPYVYVVADVAMSFRWYRIQRNTQRINELLDAADRFMASLERHEAPLIDGSAHTYQAVRELHPDIDPEDVEIPQELAVAWLDSRNDLVRFTEEEQRLKSEIAALTGNARKAVWNGHTLFTRQSRGGGTPYLVAGRNLPTGAVA